MRTRFIALTIMAMALCQSASAQMHAARDRPFAVSDNIRLHYPRDVLIGLPDEHTTFLPVADPSVADRWLVFGSSSIGAPGAGGSIVLATHTLDEFHFARARQYAQQVMRSIANFGACFLGGAAANPGFDENYAAPGSVVQDPTLPPGNLIMIYEAENHCPGGQFDHHYYATVGLARSSDNGHTWPPAQNTTTPQATRYPALVASVSEASLPPAPAGDAIPSAFVDGDYLYITYTYHSGQPTPPGDQIRVARASLGQTPLHFYKWQNGWTSEGVGGDDAPVLPQPACGGRTVMPSIVRNDDLGLYIMIFVCENATAQTGAWYYSTATSLDLQNWTAPVKIRNSERPFLPCGSSGGSQFNGFYPSLMSPEAPAGHIHNTGYVFFLRGCDTGDPREFTARTFSIGD